MSTNRPKCPICQGTCKKNGTTTKGTTRWRCTNPTCGASTLHTRPDKQLTAQFKLFHKHVMGKMSLEEIAQHTGLSRWTLNRRFKNFWLIDIPCTPDPHIIHDQIFIDATYTQAGCLLIAATQDHVLCWHWARTENTDAYIQLISQLAPPLCVVLDGGQGALTAIKKCWPTTRIQRCLVHAQRTVRRHTTSRPRTPQGKELYALAQMLPNIKTLDAAAAWLVKLHQFGTEHKEFLNEKTILPPHRNPSGTQWEYTHARVRKAYRSLVTLANQKVLFTFLEPPAHALAPHTWVGTTNKLEGGINGPVKLLARLHRGRRGERQRKMIEWWLHSKTLMPDDPVEIARQCRFGQDQLSKAKDLANPDENTADTTTGRPALYDNAIPVEYTHNLGIRKGPLR